MSLISTFSDKLLERKWMRMLTIPILPSRNIQKTRGLVDLFKQRVLSVVIIGRSLRHVA